jgi:hypothetical protein
MQLGGGSVAPKDVHGVSKTWGVLNTNLKAGEYHGGDSTLVANDGFITLAFQRWENPEEMTSAAIQWRGEIQGPIQQSLIKRHKPNAQVDNNWADIDPPI